MIRSLSTAVAALAASVMLLGGAPAGSSPAAAPAPSPTPRVVTMICGSPLYLWAHGMPLPDRSIAGGVSLGQQFTVLAGPLMTNRATSYIQIDVATIELDYPGDHYWILRDCALPTIR